VKSADSMKSIWGYDMQIDIIDFNSHGDRRGQLIAIEALKDIPFEVKRVYFLYNTTPGVSRGFHAHKALQQVLICVSGSCRILLDNGRERESVILDSPAKGVYVSNTMWREMHDFSDDAVLLVLASEYYDEQDYIRDYQDFIDYINSNNEI